MTDNTTLVRISRERLAEIRALAAAGNRPIARELDAILAAGIQVKEELAARVQAALDSRPQ